jgi:hypothetical protein
VMVVVMVMMMVMMMMMMMVMMLLLMVMVITWLPWTPDAGSWRSTAAQRDSRETGGTASPSPKNNHYLRNKQMHINIGSRGWHSRGELVLLRLDLT